MDTEEHIEIQKAIENGQTQTDEGPYYHESWWEAYKGSAKGKLGGLIIGAAMGAMVGGILAGVLAIAGSIEVPAVFIIIAGFGAGGMLYGSEEFSQIGTVTGAVAAAHQKAEERMKSFEGRKFRELKNEIREIKSMLTGTAPASTGIDDNAAKEDDDNYRTRHIDNHKVEKRKLLFWKVALVGLAIGAAAGGLLVKGGFDHALMMYLGKAGLGLSEKALGWATVTALGLFGASFGINRDIFRYVFDKTDLLFKGIFTSKQPEKTITPEGAAPQRSEGITTIMYDNHPDYPQSDTYHRDKVLASAKQALLSMDHTKTIPH